MKLILIHALRTPIGPGPSSWCAAAATVVQALAACWRRTCGSLASATSVVFTVLVALAALGTSPAALAQTGANADFDHLRTGFPLTERHAQARCESCHQNAIFVGTPRDCASCHRQGMRLARGNVVLPAKHLPTQQACDACHTTRTFTGARFNHSGIAPGSCLSCHNGGAATGKPAGHLATVASCETCHRSTSTWLAVTGGHSAANAVGTGTCDTCHNGVGARGKHPAHIPVPAGLAKCDSCHRSQASFTVAVRTDHSVLATLACAGCHNGTSAKGKGPTHVATTANCDSCHKSTTTWLGAGAHTAANAVGTGTCDTCHNGVAAKGKGPTHITVPAGTAKCDSCHGSQAGFTVSVKMNHTVVATAACAGCHNGTSAKGKGPTHVVTTAACDSCHKSTTTWLGAGAHTAANAVGTGTCDTCHNGVAAKGKGPTHIPVPAGAAKCDSCHKSQASFTASMTMNHTVVTTAECKTCHNGQYLAAGRSGALAKPANHVPEAQLLGGALLDCKSCHSSTTSWLTERMNHNGSQGNGAGWCKSCHDSAVRYGGTMERKTLRHEAKTGQVITDCSQSGCHRPLGTRGTPYTKW